MGKLEQWRGKPERDKHLLAIGISGLVTVVLVLWWVSSLWARLEPAQSVAVEPAKPPSPFATLVASISSTVERVITGSRSGGGTTTLR